MKSYKEKMHKYIFRASMYLDSFSGYFYPLGFKELHHEQQAFMDEYVRAIKHNILLTIFAAFSCISQGLFLQSGTLMRSCLEESFVLLDLFLNEGQAEKLLNNKYSTNNLLSRIRPYLPDHLRKWYGYFSKNFAHFGPFHPAPYKPSACYADNYVIGSGTENIVLCMSAFHIILDRIYFREADPSDFWIFDRERNSFEFNTNSRTLLFVHRLLTELISDFPPEERKTGFTYRTELYRAKL